MEKFSINVVAPTVPPEPAPDAGWQAWDIYLRALQMKNDLQLRVAAIAASAAHAEAQAATAVSMREAVVEQRELRLAMERPSPLDPARMAWEMFMRLPQVTGETELRMVDHAKDAVTEFLKRFPPPAPPAPTPGGSGA